MSVEYKVCENYVIEVPVIPLMDAIFFVDITLPAGTSITSASAKIDVYGEVKTLADIPVPWATWVCEVYLNNNFLYHASGLTFQAKSEVVDCTPYISPRTNGETRTNGFDVRVFNNGAPPLLPSYLTKTKVIISITLAINYTGENPPEPETTRVTTTPQSPAQDVINVVQMIGTIIMILPMIITLYFVTTIISLINEIIPKTERGEK